MGPDQPMYDVAIVGGGVMGCAILRELTSEGYKCILLEQHSKFLSGASGGNSGHVTDVYDSNSMSTEAILLKRSPQLNKDFYAAYNLPFKRFGGVILAMTKNQLGKLPGIVEKSHKNGVLGVRQISRNELFKLEPHMNKSALGGVYVPGECCVDPFLAPITMLHEARRQGADVIRECKVRGGKQLDDKSWELDTSGGFVKTKVVVNAAGLYGDRVENICRPSKFVITPGKGEAVVYPKSDKKLVNHMILQIPTEKSKGIIIYPTVYNNVIVGPTYEHVDDREIPQANPRTIQELVKFAEGIIPEFKNVQPIGTVVGLRPGTKQKDYHLEAIPQRHWVTVGGIRSTGLTNCLPIAEFVCKEISNKIGVSPSCDQPKSPGQAVWWKTNKGTIVMDGAEYTVTHPITKFGLWDSAELLKMSKSKL